MYRGGVSVLLVVDLFLSMICLDISFLRHVLPILGSFLFASSRVDGKWWPFVKEKRSKKWPSEENYGLQTQEMLLLIRLHEGELKTDFY